MKHARSIISRIVLRVNTYEMVDSAQLLYIYIPGIDFVHIYYIYSTAYTHIDFYIRYRTLVPRPSRQAKKKRAEGLLVYTYTQEIK